MLVSGSVTLHQLELFSGPSSQQQQKMDFFWSRSNKKSLHPGKLRYPLKIDGWKMMFFLLIVPFQVQKVSFQGCNSWNQKMEPCFQADDASLIEKKRNHLPASPVRLFQGFAALQVTFWRILPLPFTSFWEENPSMSLQQGSSWSLTGVPTSNTWLETFYYSWSCIENIFHTYVYFYTCQMHM